ncbi:hypothetical protein [Kutzneria chonburiensis]|uniref:Uncharacterized protein n=1 Tax=Kutzneria chonburiensis TaxID=1483604 RepID=A0ABV6MSH8_9PSEU|nr:hypothetical protein [Kutzneria chonburiensis]
MAKREWRLSNTPTEYRDAVLNAKWYGYELMSLSAPLHVNWQVDGRIDNVARDFPMIDLNEIRAFLAETGKTVPWVWLGRLEPLPEGMKSYWRLSLDTATPDLILRMRPSHFPGRYLASRALQPYDPYASGRRR